MSINDLSRPHTRQHVVLVLFKAPRDQSKITYTWLHVVKDRGHTIYGSNVFRCMGVYKVVRYAS